MNIAMTIMSGTCPVRVVLRQDESGNWTAKTLGEQNPVEVVGRTFNEAIDKIRLRAAYVADVA